MWDLRLASCLVICEVLLQAFQHVKDNPTQVHTTMTSYPHKRWIMLVFKTLRTNSISKCRFCNKESKYPYTNINIQICESSYWNLTFGYKFVFYIVFDKSWITQLFNTVTLLVLDESKGNCLYKWLHTQERIYIPK